MAREDIAVVTGASRGIGRGIALVLGAAGATVYATGSIRDADGKQPPSFGESMGLPHRYFTRAGAA